MSKFSQPSFLIFIIIFWFFGFEKIQAQVGIGTQTPKPETALDIDVSSINGSKGVFIPRVDIEDLTTLAPVTTDTAEKSLLVFNTNNTTGKGFYYWNGVDRWISVGKKSRNPGMQFYSYSISPVAIPLLQNIKHNEKPDASGLYEDDLLLENADLNASVITPTNDGIIIKFIGYYSVKNPGTFTITSFSDDGARVYVDGTLILDIWQNANAGGNSTNGSAFLSKGKHKFEFWYYDYTGLNYLDFRWGANQPDGLNGVINALQFSID